MLLEQWLIGRGGAAHLLGLWVPEDEVVHVAVRPEAGRIDAAGLRIHWSRGPAEVHRRQPIDPLPEFLVLMAEIGVTVRQQVMIDGHRVDGLIGDRLVIQLDVFAHHSDAAPRSRRGCTCAADGRSRRPPVSASALLRPRLAYAGAAAPAGLSRRARRPRRSARAEPC